MSVVGSDSVLGGEISDDDPPMSLFTATLIAEEFTKPVNCFEKPLTLDHCAISFPKRHLAKPLF